MFQQHAVAENPFLKDVLSLRAAVEPCLAPPASTDAASTIALLQSVLAMEIACVLRYTEIAVSHDGLKNAWIGAEFQEQANDERRHMRMAAERIEQLGGTPNFNPERLASNAGSSDATASFPRRIAENLAAEQSVIAHYRDLITHFARTDPQSAAILEEIVRDEENHTNDMQDLLAAYLG
jgi:bacterioferritin